MTTALTHRRLVYDAFGRLVRVAAVDGMDETDVALYRYNGLNMRLMWHDDADADSTLESGERFYIMHDERWRPVATFRDADAAPKEAFVWHAAGGAGQGGFGGSSYIDSLILRDRDNYTGGTLNPMTSPSDGTLEERRVFCQNWRADVVAVTKSDGTPIEYVRYSAYGEPAVYPVADLNMDGVVNSTDSTLWSDLLYSTSNASVYAGTDLDFDGADDWNSGGADGDLFYESYTANTGLSGVGRMSSPSVGNRVGYAGYQWDQTLGAYHVRYRVYLPDIGRWTRRDPLGYVDGMGLYEYVGARVLAVTDPAGLAPGDNLFGLPADFWDWYHRQVKSPGDPDLTYKDALEHYKEGKRLNKPKGDGKGKWRSGGSDSGKGTTGAPVLFLLAAYVFLDSSADALAEPKCRLYFQGSQACIEDESKCNSLQIEKDGVECQQAILVALGHVMWSEFERYRERVRWAVQERIAQWLRRSQNAACDRR